MLLQPLPVRVCTPTPTGDRCHRPAGTRPPTTHLPMAACLPACRRLQLLLCPTSARTLHGLPLAHRPLHRARLAHRQQLASTVSEEAGQAFNAGASCGAARVLSVQCSVAVWPQLCLCLEGTCCHRSLPTRSRLSVCWGCVRTIPECRIVQLCARRLQCSNWHVCVCWMPALMHHWHCAVAAHVVPAVAVSAGGVFENSQMISRGSKPGVGVHVCFWG